MNDRVGRQFIDTNVLVYAHDKLAETKTSQAKELVQSLWSSEKGALSIQVFQEFYVTVTRKLPEPITSIQALEVIQKLGQWHVHSPKIEDIEAAISLQTRYEISFWDAMIIRSALHLGCDILWSEDLNDGQRYDGLLVLNPFTPQSNLA